MVGHIGAICCGTGLYSSVPIAPSGFALKESSGEVPPGAEDWFLLPINFVTFVIANCATAKMASD